jgi:acyl carrier protein
MEDKIREIVARVAKAADPGALSEEADIYRDIGVKSTAALDLLLSLEEEFQITIPDDSFADARSIRALLALVNQLGAPQ